MKQKLKKIVQLCFVFLLLNTSVLVYSVYQETIYGEGKLQIATPKIRLVSNITNIEELDESAYSNEFQVLNYDENGQITQVDLAYKISVKANPVNAPLTFELYQIQSDGTEQKLDLTNPILFKANEKQEHLYKLMVSYDLSDEILEDNTEVFIELQTLQTN